MNNIMIVKGNPYSETGAKLNLLALDDMAESLVGSKDKNIAEQTLSHLWRQKNNRFSHEYVYEATKDGKTLGLVTCYTTSQLDRLSWPTIKQLLEIRKWPLVTYVVNHLGTIWNLISLPEARENEFHIGTIATLPESQGMGVGTKLLQHAEDMAKQNGFDKISLTVKQKNELARNLYERMGYKIMEQVDKNPFFLYRMVKRLS